jgi:quinol monooxygenase YgiN
VRQLYTHGVWMTKPGCEEKFVAGWREMAEWTQHNVAGGGVGRLLQDEVQPNRFISFGPWENKEAIETWRRLPGFVERITRLRECLETFAPATLELRVEVNATSEIEGARRLSPVRDRG